MQAIKIYSMRFAMLILGYNETVERYKMGRR